MAQGVAGREVVVRKAGAPMAAAVRASEVQKGAVGLVAVLEVGVIAALDRVVAKLAAVTKVVMQGSAVPAVVRVEQVLVKEMKEVEGKRVA